MGRSKKTWQTDLQAYDRRHLLKVLGGLATMPFAPTDLMRKLGDVLGGEARADAGAPMYFIEIDLRPQWDLGHVFVAPGLLAPGVVRGTGNRGAAIFYADGQISQVSGTSIYLTPDSQVLSPHVETIAQIDTCELPRGGVHGHEALGSTRSPGRGGTTGFESWKTDTDMNHVPGNERHLATVPTPASFFNYYSKQVDSAVANGIAMKGCVTPAHVYHVECNLPGASLDRIPTRAGLISHFARNPLPTFKSAAEAELARSVLGHLDEKFMKELAYEAGAQQSVKGSHAEATQRLLKGKNAFDLALSDTERAEWGANVVSFNPSTTISTKPLLWEMMAYAYKLIKNDIVRSIAIEFDYGTDIHVARTPLNLQQQAQQLTFPLAKLIAELKAANLYDRTVIAIYTVDGGRAPALYTPDPEAGSPAEYEGKNTVMLAGGMIKGGYYGNVSRSGVDRDGNAYAYHAPNVNTGVTEAGATGGGGRLAGAHTWVTVMEALNVPKSAYASFAPVSGANAKVLRWLLRG